MKSESMTTKQWLDAVHRRAVPDRLTIEAEKLIVAKDAVIMSLVERCKVQSDIVGKRAEKPQTEGSST